jgi:hypothetical protein
MDEALPPGEQLLCQQAWSCAARPGLLPRVTHPGVPSLSRRSWGIRLGQKK